MVDLIHKYVYTDRERAKAAPSIINGTMRLNKGAALNIDIGIQDQLSWFQSEGLVDARYHNRYSWLTRSYVDTHRRVRLGLLRPGTVSIVPALTWMILNRIGKVTHGRSA